MTKACRSIACVLGLSACLLTLAWLAPAPAEDAAPAVATEASGASATGGQQPQTEVKSDHAAAPDLLPPTSVTHHTITLSGETIHYAATAGTLPVRDQQGKTIASIFYVAYAREPGDTKRP
ncbi:MAG TPA: hypothetical protein VI390_02970, partial [Methyloceanibacter sp.]